MKKVLLPCLVALCLFGYQKSNAQTEVKVNPLGLLFGDYSIAAEFGVAEKFGVEPIVGLFSTKSGDYRLSSLRVGVLGKYYFSPKRGLDGFHVGPYTRFASGKWKYDVDDTNVKTTRLALGLYLGYKWVTEKGFLFELGAGGGRNVVQKVDDTNLSGVPVLNVDLMLRLMVGYRFGGGGDRN